MNEISLRNTLFISGLTQLVVFAGSKKGEGPAKTTKPIEAPTQVRQSCVQELS